MTSKLNQASPGVDTVIAWAKRHHGGTLTEALLDQAFPNLEWKDVSNDIWAVLTDRTSDQARRVVTTATIGFDAVSEGHDPGIDASKKMHRWAVELSGISVTKKDVQD